MSVFQKSMKGTIENFDAVIIIIIMIVIIFFSSIQTTAHSI